MRAQALRASLKSLRGDIWVNKSTETFRFRLWKNTLSSNPGGVSPPEQRWCCCENSTCWETAPSSSFNLHASTWSSYISTCQCLKFPHGHASPHGNAPTPPHDHASKSPHGHTSTWPRLYVSTWPHLACLKGFLTVLVVVSIWQDVMSLFPFFPENGRDLLLSCNWQPTYQKATPSNEKHFIFNPSIKR